LVQNVARLAPFASLVSTPLGRDPAAWFMSGVVIAGWVVYLILSHPAYSQAYFLRLANPVASVFGAWALAAAVPRTPTAGRRVAAVLAGGLLLGAAAVGLGRAVTPALAGRMDSLTAVMASFATPLAVLSAVIIAGVVGWRVARRRVPALCGWGSVLVLAALVLGGPAQGAIDPTANALVAVVADRPVPAGIGYRLSPAPPPPWRGSTSTLRTTP
jgi:hypothetical protein